MHIPFANVWPFSYSTSYELKVGGSVLPFYHPDFSKHYQTVGPFPEMKLSIKMLKTRLTKAFFGPAQPII